MDDITKTVKSRKNSDVLIDGASETVEHEIKKTRRWISFCCDGTSGCFIDGIYGLFIDTNCCFFISKDYNWKRGGKEQED